MRPFDNRVLLLVGAHLRAEVLDHCVGRHPEGVGHVIEVRDVGLDAVESGLLFEHHLGHRVSEWLAASTTCMRGQ